VSRLDHAAFCGPSGSTASDQIFTADSFYVWLLTTFDNVCLPLMIVSNCAYLLLYCAMLHIVTAAKPGANYVMELC